jgi:hypothetical protein
VGILGRRLVVTMTVSLLAVVAPACTEQTPPVTAADSGLTAQAWVVPQDDVVGFIQHRGGSLADDAFAPLRGEQAAVVRVGWTSQELPSNTRYQIVVLDPTGQDAARNLLRFPAVTTGWDGRYDQLGVTYPWLQATLPSPMSEGLTEETTSAAFAPGTQGPLWIVALFPRNSAIEVARPNDIPIVGAFLTSDPDERIWWAQRLTGA